MEEGQLKKRIDQIVHLKIENDDAHCVTCGVKYDPKLKPQNYMISSEGMKNWIDEAKQEFPVFGHIETEFLKKRQIMPVDDIKQEFVHAVYNWFEKWFGTEEKKHE